MESPVTGTIRSQGAANSLPPGIKRSALPQKTEGKPPPSSSLALEALRSLSKTFPKAGTGPAERKEWLKALGDKKRYAVHQYAKLNEVDKLHQAVAISFNQDENAEKYSEPDAFKKLEENPNVNSKLHHLLAQGSHHRTILHIILDLNTYGEQAGLRFPRLKALIKLLLWIQPELPKVAANGDATPLFNLVKSQADKTDYDEDAGSAAGSDYDETETPCLDDKTKSEIIKFLCEPHPAGIGSKQAIESLGLPTASSASDDTSQARNAIHAAIEADFAMPEDIIAKLSKISIAVKAADNMTKEEKPCLEIPDRLGRTCLHIALTPPFSETKIVWARQLAKYQPSLLKAKYKSGPELEVTPLQHFTKQRGDNDTATHKDKDKISAKALAAVNLPKELDLMEEYLKCQCLEAFENETCKSIMYIRENGQYSHYSDPSQS